MLINLFSVGTPFGLSRVFSVLKTYGCLVFAFALWHFWRNILNQSSRKNGACHWSHLFLSCGLFKGQLKLVSKWVVEIMHIKRWAALDSSQYFSSVQIGAKKVSLSQSLKISFPERLKNSWKLWNPFWILDFWCCKVFLFVSLSCELSWSDFFAWMPTLVTLHRLMDTVGFHPSLPLHWSTGRILVEIYSESFARNSISS